MLDRADRTAPGHPATSAIAPYRSFLEDLNHQVGIDLSIRPKRGTSIQPRSRVTAYQASPQRPYFSLSSHVHLAASCNLTEPFTSPKQAGKNSVISGAPQEETLSRLPATHERTKHRTEPETDSTIAPPPKTGDIRILIPKHFHACKERSIDDVGGGQGASP